MSDWEFSENECPKCKSQLATRRCDSLGCEDGTIEDDDGLGWKDTDKCDECNGTSFQEWCRECGWDVTYRQFLNPKCEAEYSAKQGDA